jgi:hypothetical protein
LKAFPFFLVQLINFHLFMLSISGEEFELWNLLSRVGGMRDE